MSEEKKYPEGFYFGKVKKHIFESGHSIYKGFLGNTPVIGFIGKKDPESINFKIDTDYIKWKMEHESKKDGPAKPEQEAPQDDDLSF